MRGTLLGTLASVAAFALSPTPSMAGTFSISPIRVDLAAGTATGVVTLRNQENVPVVVQAEVHLWEQGQDGADRLSPTRDLLVTPAVFTVPANAAQVVRIALRREPADSTELSYRLVLTEVPQPGTSTTSGLNFALQMSLPVFVEARQKTAPQLRWNVAAEAGGTLRLTALNDGSAHARVLDLQVRPLDAASGSATVDPAGAAYLLPGQARSWRVTPGPDAGTATPWQRLRVKGVAEDGNFSEELAVLTQ